MKLTEKQMQVLSDMLHKYLNNQIIDSSKYSKITTSKLKDLEIINEECLPITIENKAIIAYLSNLKKNMIFKNENDEKILLYKESDGKGWEFIWFMTKDKTGGGNISYIDLVSKYRLD